jgi:hypothetical protein
VRSSAADAALRFRCCGSFFNTMVLVMSHVRSFYSPRLSGAERNNPLLLNGVFAA